MDAQPQHTPQVPKQTSGLAITSLVCGIASFLFPFLPALVAIISGHLSRSRIKKSGGFLQGKGMALAGLICGYFTLLLTITLISWWVYAVKEENRLEQERFAKDMRNGKEIHALVLKYEADHGKFPDRLSELVEKGYIHSLDHLQPQEGHNWIYWAGQTSKSPSNNFLIRSSDDIVIFIDGSATEYSVGSWTTEPTDYRMKNYERVDE